MVQENHSKSHNFLCIYIMGIFGLAHIKILFLHISLTFLAQFLPVLFRNVFQQHAKKILENEQRSKVSMFVKP